MRLNVVCSTESFTEVVVQMYFFQCGRDHKNEVIIYGDF